MPGLYYLDKPQFASGEDHSAPKISPHPNSTHFPAFVAETPCSGDTPSAISRFAGHATQDRNVTRSPFLPTVSSIPFASSSPTFSF